MLLEGRTIAVIEDDPIMGESLAQSLALEGAKVSLYPCGRAALKGASPHSLDLVVCDIRLPDTDGQSLFRHFGMTADAPPFLFMTAFADVNEAVTLMRDGAADYVTKPFDMQDFLRRVQGSMRRMPHSGEGDGILGVSAAMRDIEHLLRQVSQIESPVLITGETGTGKEVCARLLHGISRKEKPFMAVNCAAIPGDLMESELFGHEAGAFTGASRRHLGFAERAGEGTLFLDEIGDLAPALQAKLLRLLEDRQFYRLGGEMPVAFKARLVSATNADLGARMSAKQFRCDLYYRINVVEVNIPPLRERRQDIPWLLGRIWADFSARNNGGPRGISALAEEAAVGHAWPGNIRELRNRLERALALSLTGWISPEDLFPEKRSACSAAERSISLADAREAAEKRCIEAALEENGWQIGKTAECLEVSRTTLWEKMKRYGLAAE